jgi:hypothetical protein
LVISHLRPAGRSQERLSLSYLSSFRGPAQKTLPMPKTQRFPGAPIESPDTQIFDKPFLAGPAPLSGGADLLEYWAKQLP